MQYGNATLQDLTPVFPLGIVTAALIIGSSIVMHVKGTDSVFGLPSLGLLGFLAAVVGGVWVLVSVWRSGK